MSWENHHLKGGGPEQVFLEPISEARRAEFLALAKASRGFHRQWSNAPSTDLKYSRYMERIGNDSFACFFVCRRLDGALVGVINVSQIYRGNFRSAYLGYYVFAPFARKGYMTSALAQVLRTAFRKMRLHRLEANIQPGNVASKKLAKRLGFRREGYSERYLKVDGEWRDHERWAITVEDWRKGDGKPKAREPSAWSCRP